VSLIHKSNGVLGTDEIRTMCKGKKPLLTDYVSQNFIGAKYDLRMSRTGLVLPDGKIIRPNDEPYGEDVFLGSGETIFVSTEEKLRLPLNVVGNMSIKGQLARKGVLSLTGLIVDPGYEKGDSADGRLHFRLANLGSRPIALTPGVTKIASIQFVRLAKDAEALPQGSLPNVWAHEENLREGLGFIDEIKKVQAEIRELSLSFERQKRSVDFVVLGGILVILVTLLGVAISGLLSLGADSGIVSAAKNVIPDGHREQVLSVTLVLGLAALASSTLIALAYRTGAGVLDLDDRMLARQEAFREERLLRYRQVGIYVLTVTALLALSVAVPVGLGAPTWVVVASGVIVALAGILLFPRLGWRSISSAVIQKRISDWRKDQVTGSPSP